MRIHGLLQPAEISQLTRLDSRRESRATHGMHVAAQGQHLKLIIDILRRPPAALCGDRLLAAHDHKLGGRARCGAAPARLAVQVRRMCMLAACVCFPSPCQPCIPEWAPPAAGPEGGLRALTHMTGGKAPPRQLKALGDQAAGSGLGGADSWNTLGGARYVCALTQKAVPTTLFAAQDPCTTPTMLHALAPMALPAQLTTSPATHAAGPSRISGQPQAARQRRRPLQAS